MFQQIFHILYAAIIVLFLFNLTIFVHELGHYLIGRWRGAKIERFAIWFGPAIWSKTINGVEFRLGCIPVGGYVAFPQLGMEAVEGKSETPAEKLEPLKPKDKIPILFAGSFANILLAFVIACIVWIVGVPRDASDSDLTIGFVPKHSPEYQAGIQPGDKIVSINEKVVGDWEEIHQYVALSLSEKVKIGINRNGPGTTIEIIPERNPFLKIRILKLEHANVPIAGTIQPHSPAEKAGIQPNDEFLNVDGGHVLGTAHLIELIRERPNQRTKLTLLRQGKPIEIEVTPKIEKKSGEARMGVGLAQKEDSHRITVYPTPWKQIKGSLLSIVDTINALVHRKTTGVGVSDLQGPVGISRILYLLITLDFRLALAFLVLFNINLAVINLLPIPVLDGGHIVFSLIESILRRPLNQKVMEATQTVFVALLITFIVYVTFNDLTRLTRFGHGNASIQSFEEQMP